MLILDCEDSVKPEEKEAAREAAAKAAGEGFDGRTVAIRINGSGETWHDGDCAAVAGGAADYVVLPKAESVAEVERVAAACGKPVLAMIETPRALFAAEAIAQASAGLLVGTNDLRAELGIAFSDDRSGLTYALQAVVAAARAAGIAAFDGVYNRLEDDTGFTEQCREGRAFGFDGKSLIHPSQIATANRLFSPSQEEVDEARRLIAAAGGGAERFEGRMIESLHVAQAEALVAKAQRS